MGEIDKNNLDLDFIITDDIEKALNDSTVSGGAIIYERGEKKNLYVGDERVTDNFNTTGDESTPTIIGDKTLGDFKDKSISEVVEEIITSDLDTGVKVYKSSEFDAYGSESDIDVPTNSFIVDDSMELGRPVLHRNAVTIDGTYLDIMMNTIRALQSEVARLKNAFDYGIVSYKNEDTAISRVVKDYDETTADEPLWALDPDNLSEISSAGFNDYLDINHSFYFPLNEGEINTTIPEQLTFTGSAIWPKYDDNTTSDIFKNLKDSKIIGYLVTDSKDITVNLLNLKNEEVMPISFSNILGDNVVDKYGIMFVISRKNEDSVNNQLEGHNYFYASVINYDNRKTIVEGYLKRDGTLGFNAGSTTRYDLDYRYTIKSLEVKDLTLYRMKYYTKYEDFIDEVVPSAPDEGDYKIEAAHITIRSVANRKVLDNVKNQLMDDELIWNKKDKTLHIKSNGVIYNIGAIKPDEGDSDSDINYDDMTDREIIEALERMGIITNVEYEDNGDIKSLKNLKFNRFEDFTMINGDTGKEFTFGVDAYGSLVGKEKGGITIEEQLGKDIDLDTPVANVRGFSAEYLRRMNVKNPTNEPNGTGDYGVNSDRLRVSSFYAPLKTDRVHGCTHSFIELENSSETDIPLDGVYLHYYSPVDEFEENGETIKGRVYHLTLDGVIPAGGTYLVRGARHANDDDINSFIKVSSYDKEWYADGKLISFEQEIVKLTEDGKNYASDSPIKNAYRFCLTYGLPDLKATDRLVEIVDKDSWTATGGLEATKSTYPNKILNRRFIDSCAFSSFGPVAKQTGSNDPSGNNNPWYCNGDGGVGITIKTNSMFRNTFALDPAKQAFNGFTTNDGSRVRYNKDQDIQVVDLSKEYIGYPNSDEIVLISRYTPKASYEHKNVMTDKSQLDKDKPNMVNCSFGIDVYKTRCFNWISCGVFDEYVWIRRKATDEEGESWKRFESYKPTTGVSGSRPTTYPGRVEFNSFLNNAAYARIISRFPGNNIQFTSHKCILDIVDNVDTPTVYEYVVGRMNKDGMPDKNHTSDIQTFTIYPRDYEGRVYQITDQQGFHWIEYQVWAAAAQFLNKQIKDECDEINANEGKVFPIIINTGDASQSGARVNEWLDYYNGGKCLFNHLEHMYTVGNNDLCDVDPLILGTGNDPGKSNGRFCHYFFAFEVPNDENLVVKAHEDIQEDRYIPSTYYFNTKDVMYLVCNSEITSTTCDKWFGLHSSNKIVNLYTGIEMDVNGEYVTSEGRCFTPIYETLYSWLKGNRKNDGSNIKKVVAVCHEIPFTVITRESLSNKTVKSLPATRNYPTGGTSSLGCHMNQIDSKENRGIYWFSRLLEYFGCKLVIGGHKHTYALTYPIKEKYIWKNGENWIDSIDQIKPMNPTLADEAGSTPEKEVKWNLDLTQTILGKDILTYNKGLDDNTTYGIDKMYNITVTSNGINTTKLPYIPNNLYNEYGFAKVEDKIDTLSLFICCTPVEVSDEKYDGYVNYSMCQATGYKLKSNKELPSEYQMFSKIIPQTQHTVTNPDDVKSTDKPDGNQLFPMYSVLSISSNQIDVDMCRITGIFLTDKKDVFTQNDYGDRGMNVEYLVAKDNLYGKWTSNKTIGGVDYSYLIVKY